VTSPQKIVVVARRSFGVESSTLFCFFSIQTLPEFLEQMKKTLVGGKKVHFSSHAPVLKVGFGAPPPPPGRGS
jgi:hypothetical protein